MPRVRVENMGEPIRISDLDLSGVSAEAAQPSDNVQLWTHCRALPRTPSIYEAAAADLRR